MRYAFRCLIPLLSMIVLCGWARADEKEYEVRIHRPDRAGMKFDVSITSAIKREMITTMEGRPTREPESVMAMELKAVAEIVEVDEQGRDLKVTYLIERCVKVEEDKEEEILPKGALLTTTLGPDGKRTVYTVKEGKLTDAQTEALDLVADLPAKEAALADDLYGVKGRQKIGATWEVSSAAMAEDLKRNDYQAKPDAITGSVKLEGLEKANGIQCLHLKGEMKVNRAKFKAPDEANARMAIRNVTIESNFSWLLPVDVSLNHVAANGTVTSTYVMAGQAAGGVEWKRDLKTTRMYEVRAIPLP
jgi:hypothetical protein